MKRWLIWLHRYLGIPMSVVFVVWFLSGIVMMYTGGMPVLGERDRLAGRGPLDLAAVTLSPGDAASQAGLTGAVTGLRLQTLLGRPAYRISRRNGRDITVFADTGAAFNIADPDQARAEVARFTGVAATAVQFIRTLDSADQWTITESASLPLDLFSVADGAGTRVYFSRQSGEVELVTDRVSRGLAWAGAIPHWFYFTPLRTRQPLWFWSVVWVAALGCLLAALGLVLAFTQFRRSRPFRWSQSIRYRGWWRWHYISGALFGVFALTWVFSGLLSMEPFAWTNASGLRLPPAATGAATLDLTRYAVDPGRIGAALGGADAYEIEFADFAGTAGLIVATLAAPQRRLLDAASFVERHEALPVEFVLDRLTRADTGAAVQAHVVLNEFDAYYYARNGAAPLPVLRVQFDDPAGTWYYFDLLTGAPVFTNHRLSRVERWLFNGLHSLDFGFWYQRRPLWDLGMLLLLGGALLSSGIGLYLGWQRLFRSITVNKGKP